MLRPPLGCQGGYRQRAVVSAGTATGVVAAAGVLGWAAGSPVAICHALAADPDFEHLFTHVAALAAWVGLSWFCIAVGLEVLGRLPGFIGRACSAVAASVNPRILRRLAQAAVGLTVLAGPVSTPSAWAATVVTVAGSTTVTTPADVSVDRPLGAGPAADMGRSGPAPALPLDRPAGPFIALPPTPPSIVTPTAPAAIVAGVPHREAPREGYVVRRGDALWNIAARHLGPAASATDIAREWPRWYAANRSVIGPDPNLLRPGELLSPPAH
jgi:resuscitation-promoting factor RpfA